MTFYLRDLAAYGQLAAQLSLEPGGSGQVVGVGVGFQQPVDDQPLLADAAGDTFGPGVGSAAAGGAVIQHRVDDGAAAAGGVADDVAVGTGGRIEEGLHPGGHEVAPLRLDSPLKYGSRMPAGALFVGWTTLHRSTIGVQADDEWWK
ncbi:hypothetical protein D3C72_1990550 [compost metagenome]